MNRNLRSMLGDLGRTLQNGSPETACVSSGKSVSVFVLVVGSVFGLSGIFASASCAQERAPVLPAPDVPAGNLVTDLSAALARVGSRQATLNVTQAVAVSANTVVPENVTLISRTSVSCAAAPIPAR
jgi:hypothetical protein